MKKTLTSKEACTLAHQIKKNTGCTLAEAFKLAYSGQTEATPKTTWTYADLNQIFSDKVAELLRKGYSIDTAHMGGHQGEVAKIFLVKGKDHYVIVMDTTSNWDNWYSETYHIRFGKYSEPVTYDRQTLWLDKFEYTWEFQATKITANWFVTAELGKEYSDKHHSRINARRQSYWTDVDSKFYKVVLACVRKQRGFKGTKLSDIARVQRCVETRLDGSVSRHQYCVTLARTNKYGNNVTVDIKF